MCLSDQSFLFHTVYVLETESCCQYKQCIPGSDYPGRVWHCDQHVTLWNWRCRQACLSWEILPSGFPAVQIAWWMHDLDQGCRLLLMISFYTHLNFGKHKQMSSIWFRNLVAGINLGFVYLSMKWSVCLISEANEFTKNISTSDLFQCLLGVILVWAYKHVFWFALKVKGSFHEDQERKSYLFST